MDHVKSVIDLAASSRAKLPVGCVSVARSLQTVYMSLNSEEMNELYQPAVSGLLSILFQEPSQEL